MGNGFRDVAAAFALLTRLPVPSAGTGDDAHGPARAVWAYPLVGLAIGLLGALIMLLLIWLGLPEFLAAGAGLGAQIWATGALHEDGLADVADGFGGGADKARKLEIMRDSRIGAFGVIVLILVLGLRWGAMAELPVAEIAAGLIVAGALGRAAMVAMLKTLKPARADGLGAGVANPPDSAVGTAALLVLGIAFLLLPALAALLAIAVLVLSAAVAIWLARTQIGGYTGDVLGAGEQIAETAVLIALAAYFLGA